MAGGLMQGTSTASARGFRRIVFLLVSLVTVPTALMLAIGILMLVFYDARLNVVFGIMITSLVACVVTGVVISFVMLRREANIAKLQMDFVSKVSHELRTPLTSIRLFVETLQMKRFESPEALDQCIDVLGKETERLATRIDRLLDWGRMEAGRRVYDLCPERIDTLIADAVSQFDASTLGRKVALELDIPSDLPEVLADRAAIEDLLVNLLTNAYKYTGDEKRIQIGARADEKWVRVWVKDNGIGIARGEHRRVFDKFYRVDERLSRAVEGSGLGLAIVRHVARAHRGRIELESATGQGSTFTLMLPRPREAQLQEARRVETPAE